MNIIPETDEARQMVREWATQLVAADCACGTNIVQTAYERGHSDHEFEAPAWPESLTPPWARKVKVSYQGLGEAGVTFSLNYGETVIEAFITVIVGKPHAHFNPDKGVGDWIEHGLEINIVGPHEGMSLIEAEDVLGSLARSVARLQQIKAVGA